MATVSRPRRGPPVFVMESTEDGQSEHRCIARMGGAVGNTLLHPLVRSRIVEVGDVLSQARAHLLLGEDEDVVEVFAADAPDESLAERVGLRRPYRVLST